MFKRNKVLVMLIAFFVPLKFDFSMAEEPIKQEKFNYVDTKSVTTSQAQFIQLLFAHRYLKRWHASPELFPKPLSAHLLDTCWFTYLLVVRHNELTGDSIDPFRAAFLASIHDFLEVFTGDILSQTKHFHPDMKNICLETERKAFSDFLKTVPPELMGNVNDVFSIFLKNPDELSPEETKILGFIKFADLMSAFLECLEELSVGNQAFLQPSTYLSKKLCKLSENNPAMEYFNDILVSLASQNCPF